MITRKENLLVRPFQQRKYEEHRHKVTTALPRIDDMTPPVRNHVYIKCKKLQTEAERHAKIERDNFILLKHLSDIMKMKRIDNCWLYEHPKFLQRIKLFRPHSAKVQRTDRIQFIEFPKHISKKERCIACHPENYTREEIIPEERVPWEMKPVREVYSAKLPERRKQAKESNDNKSRNRQFTDVKLRKVRIPQLMNSKQSSIEKKNSPPEKIFHDHSTTEKSSDEKPLRVVIKFPPKAHVTLNAGISDEVT